MNTLTDAQDSAHRADATSAVASEAQKSQQQLQQLRQQMDAAVSNQNKTAYQRDLENVNANFNQTVTAANSIANDKTFFSQGFHSQADANAYAEHLKNDAEKIHNSDLAKLAGDRYDEMQTGNEQLEVLQRLGAGDKVGAAREALESGLNAKERQIDPNDIEKIKQYEQISKQSLANFDAGAARQSKLQESQTDDQIAGFQEEAKEAQLRAAGRDDEAMVAALTFSTQQRVRSLQEQVDAEIDPTRKAQLQREIAAASDAGTIETGALQQQIQHEHLANTQASALSGASQLGSSNLNSLHESGPSNLSEALRKLDNATAKLDKALSHSKTLVLVKD